MIRQLDSTNSFILTANAMGNWGCVDNTHDFFQKAPNLFVSKQTRFLGAFLI